MTDEGQAVVSVADLGSNVVKATLGAGGYFVKILGNIPEDVLGLLGGDWLHYRRRLNVQELEGKFQKRIAETDQGRLSAPNPSILMPLLLAARDESDNLLQDMWAALLAGCMTDHGATVRRSFVETLQRLDSPDALVLCCHDRVPPHPGGSSGNTPPEIVQSQINWVAHIARSRGIDQDGLSVSQKALSDLGLIQQIGPHLTSPKSQITPFGRLFLRAVDPDQKLDFLSGPNISP